MQQFQGGADDLESYNLAYSEYEHVLVQGLEWGKRGREHGRRAVGLEEHDEAEAIETFTSRSGRVNIYQ